MDRDPMTLVSTAYYLALATAIVVVVAALLPLIPVEALSICGQAVWLGLITSGIGAFMGRLARGELKGQELDKETRKQLRVGYWFNLAFFVLLMLLFVYFVIITILNATLDSQVVG